jgi:hypothetical protein
MGSAHRLSGRLAVAVSVVSTVLAVSSLHGAGCNQRLADLPARSGAERIRS